MSNTLNIIIYLVVSYIYVAALLIYVEKHKTIQLYSSNRLATIDGLRGYLALGVFTHHFVVTYYWYKTGVWYSPSENFLNNIGQASVVMFFMITGYLFSKKIKSNNFEIRKFFVKRFFRLMPLLFTVVTIMVWIVFIKQKFVLYDEPIEIFKQIIAWLLFMQPNINHLMHTDYITAGVTWTLKYEAIFYLALPLLYFIRKNKALFILIVSILFLIIVRTLFLLFFIGYIISEIENRYKNKFNFNANIISIINILIIIFVLFYFKSSYHLLSFILLGISFALIVLGNTLFGILSNKFSIILGEISYSIYLTHGLILYILFNLILKDEPTLYYLPIVMTIVIFVSLITFKYIEKPFNDFGHAITRQVKGAL